MAQDSLTPKQMTHFYLAPRVLLIAVGRWRLDWSPFVTGYGGRGIRGEVGLKSYTAHEYYGVGLFLWWRVLSIRYLRAHGDQRT